MYSEWFGGLLLGIVRRIQSLVLYGAGFMKASCRKRFSRFHVEGPLVPFVQPYMAHLAEQGFSQVSFWKKTFLIGEFSKWLKRRDVCVEQVTPDHPHTFLRDRARSRRVFPGSSIALAGIVSWLAEKGVIACPTNTADHSEADRLVLEYSMYLQQERGLEQTTIKLYTGVVGRFLQRAQHSHRVQLRTLKAQDVCDFVSQYAPRTHTFSMGKDATSALRSFLRFAHWRGYIHHDLAAAVPAVPGWSMASIPRAMPMKVVRRVLAHSKRRRTPLDFVIERFCCCWLGSGCEPAKWSC